MSLAAQIKYEEGLRLTMYKCSQGFKTIGIGHNLDAHPTFNGVRIPYTIDESFALLLFEYDVRDAKKHIAEEWTAFKYLDSVRQDAIVNMCFQLGVNGFLKFVNTIAMIEAKNWEGVKTNLEKSLWYKQTPKRAKRVINQLVTGVPYVV